MTDDLAAFARSMRSMSPSWAALENDPATACADCKRTFAHRFERCWQIDRDGVSPALCGTCASNRTAMEVLCGTCPSERTPATAKEPVLDPVLAAALHLRAGVTMTPLGEATAPDLWDRCVAFDEALAKARQA